MPSADGSRFTPDHLKGDRESLRKLLLDHLAYSLGKNAAAATPRDWLHAAAFAVRDHMVERWMETTTRYLRNGSQARLLPLPGISHRAAALEQPAEHRPVRHVPRSALRSRA